MFGVVRKGYVGRKSRIMKCVECPYMVEYDRYKTMRKDGNDCILMVCQNPKVQSPYSDKPGFRRICTYRPFGGLRTGKDARIKTSPIWCPFKGKQSYE